MKLFSHSSTLKIIITIINLVVCKNCKYCAPATVVLEKVIAAIASQDLHAF